MERESMEVDVLIVGAGPAGLAAACRLAQLAKERGQDISICVLEKGSEVGAHILSGAVFEPTALDELFPDWKERGAPLNIKAAKDDIRLLGKGWSLPVPSWMAPHTMRNHGNYIISLGNLCRWLKRQAEDLGVDVFDGFPAQELIESDGVIKGVITADMGRGADGEKTANFQPGMELRAAYTLFAEGCRGHLGKRLIQRFDLDADSQPQHYGIGLKEIWEVPAEAHSPGRIIHTAGWPLNDSGASGGGFLYHAEDNQLSLGLIVDLNYENPHLDPYMEFQRFKRHPLIAKTLEDGKRLGYGARAIAKGGLQSLPRMHFPGGLLIGCDAGTLNYAKIKGSHTAMKSGMVAAEVVHQALAENKRSENLDGYQQAFLESWAGRELRKQRNFGPAQHKLGNILGSAYAFFDLNLLRGKAPWTLGDPKPDHESMKSAADCAPIDYPKPDGKLSFDRMSSVFLSNTNHEENQPCHLKLHDSDTPLRDNLPRFDEPAQRYCPAGVYEIVTEGDSARFQINAQNCVHCKTCDIKDPAQNIEWVAPEGGGGPNYPNM